MRRFPALAALLLASCASPVERELASLRAEIARLEKSIPPEAPLWIFEGPDRFDQFLDDASPSVPDFIYVHLLRKLHAMRPEEPAALTMADFDPELCDRDPAKFRGRFFRVHGIIGRIRAEPLDREGAPVERVHEGFFFSRGDRPVHFVVVHKPEVLMLREDYVETHAVFVKMIRHALPSGRHIAVPFFVGKTLRKFV